MAYASVDDMRYIISRVYPSDKWRSRVRRMSDNQVCAIYFSFLEQGKFDKKPVKKSCQEPVERPCTESLNEPRTDAFAVDTAEQMSFEL
jgi:hypothetical protein